MSRKRKPTLQDQIEGAIRNAGTIGNLERLAGIGQSFDERYAFWTTYSPLPGAQALDAGVAELKRRIRLQAIADPPS